MSNLLRDELDKVRDQLVKSGVCANACKGCCAVFITVLIEHSAAGIGEVKLELLRKKMFDERFDGDIIGTTDGGDMGICPWTLGHELLVP